MKLRTMGRRKGTCRCGNILIGNLCFGCDNLPDNCSCVEMVFVRTPNPAGIDFRPEL